MVFSHCKILSFSLYSLSETNVFPADFPAKIVRRNSREFCCRFSNLDEFSCR